MSGTRRQHYVPRFLLRRFSSRTQGDKAWIWQYARGSEPVEISVRDAAVSEYFYGRDSAADAGFTDLEPVFSRCLASLDSGPQLTDEQIADLTVLVWTLAVRTRAIRMQLVELYDRMCAELYETLVGPEGQDLLLQFWRRNLESMVTRDLRAVPRWQRALAWMLLRTRVGRAWLLLAVERSIRSPDFPDSIEPYFRDIRNREAILKAASEAQNRGLKRLFESSTKLPEHFAPEGWTLQRHNDSFILGDCCVMALNREGLAASIAKHYDAWTSCLLPIDPGTLLVGHASTARPAFPPSEVNRAVAALSHRHFWASSRREELRELAESIGTGTPLIDFAERQTLMRQAFSGPVSSSRPSSV